MANVLCFGELLLRMSPALPGAWIERAGMPVYIGGAELNVATALARWDIPVAYCTVLPKNELATDICEELRKRKISTDPIQFGGDRIGIYFLPQGADLKHASVIYDRQHSAFASVQPGTLDWDKILHGITWFHFSAISPALGQHTALLCREALEAATQKKITVSADLNYRSRLWQYGLQPDEVMPALIDHCDVVMGNIWSAGTLLGIPVNADIHQHDTPKEALLAHAKTTAEEIQRRFPRCRTIANTFRFDDGEKGIRYYAALNEGHRQYDSVEFNTNTVEDKVGSGDCFMAGLIYGLIREHPLKDIVNFAASAAFGKLQEVGDSTRQDIDTILDRIVRHG